MITVYGEATPNPETLKFVTNKPLAAEPHDYEGVEAAADSPLAQSLFAFPYVRAVFIASDFISVSKQPDVEWFEIMNELRLHIIEFLQSGQPVFNTTAGAPGVDRQPNELVNLAAIPDQVHEPEDAINTRISDILEEYVKPAVESDGGAIQFHSFVEGVVKLTLKGACSGCPSSEITLKNGIETLLTSMVPEVKSVIAVSSPS